MRDRDFYNIMIIASSAIVLIVFTSTIVNYYMTPHEFRSSYFRSMSLRKIEDRERRTQIFKELVDVVHKKDFKGEDVLLKEMIRFMHEEEKNDR